LIIQKYADYDKKVKEFEKIGNIPLTIVSLKFNTENLDQVHWNYSLGVTNKKFDIIDQVNAQKNILYYKDDKFTGTNFQTANGPFDGTYVKTLSLYTYTPGKGEKVNKDEIKPE
jgi:hypothetical protein